MRWGVRGRGMACQPGRAGRGAEAATGCSTAAQLGAGPGWAPPPVPPIPPPPTPQLPAGIDPLMAQIIESRVHKAVAGRQQQPEGAAAAAGAAGAPAGALQGATLAAALAGAALAGAAAAAAALAAGGAP
jgi:hypothetical protein